MLKKIFSFFLLVFALPGRVLAAADVIVDQKALGFAIPTLGDLLTFIIRGFFIIAGLMALLYLLLGGLTWVTSGGNKENVDKARDKITNAIIGVIVIIATLAIIATLEQIVFGGRLCFGVTCKITIPELLKAP